jgi:hypothetical protein
MAFNKLRLKGFAVFAFNICCFWTAITPHTLFPSSAVGFSEQVFSRKCIKFLENRAIFDLFRAVINQDGGGGHFSKWRHTSASQFLNSAGVFCTSVLVHA